MTYFSYRNARGTRGEDVYEGTTLLGRVAMRRDWRSRLTLRTPEDDVYCATRITGEPIPGLYPSRHDAAEALFAQTSDAPGEDEGTTIRSA
jgi:hypothetical protein